MMDRSQAGYPQNPSRLSSAAKSAPASRLPSQLLRSEDFSAAETGTSRKPDMPAEAASQRQKIPRISLLSRTKSLEAKQSTTLTPRSIVKPGIERPDVEMLNAAASVPKHREMKLPKPILVHAAEHIPASQMDPETPPDAFGYGMESSAGHAFQRQSMANASRHIPSSLMETTPDAFGYGMHHGKGAPSHGHSYQSGPRPDLVPAFEHRRAPEHIPSRLMETSPDVLGYSTHHGDCPSSRPSSEYRAESLADLESLHSGLKEAFQALSSDQPYANETSEASRVPHSLLETAPDAYSRDAEERSEDSQSEPDLLGLEAILETEPNLHRIERARPALEAEHRRPGLMRRSQSLEDEPMTSRLSKTSPELSGFRKPMAGLAEENGDTRDQRYVPNAGSMRPQQDNFMASLQTLPTVAAPAANRLMRPSPFASVQAPHQLMRPSPFAAVQAQVHADIGGHHSRYVHVLAITTGQVSQREDLSAQRSSHQAPNPWHEAGRASDQWPREQLHHLHPRSQHPAKQPYNDQLLDRVQNGRASDSWTRQQAVPQQAHVQQQLPQQPLQQPHAESSWQASGQELRAWPQQQVQPQLVQQADGAQWSPSESGVFAQGHAPSYRTVPGGSSAADSGRSTPMHHLPTGQPMSPTASTTSQKSSLTQKSSFTQATRDHDAHPLIPRDNPWDVQGRGGPGSVGGSTQSSRDDTAMTSRKNSHVQPAPQPIIGQLRCGRLSEHAAPEIPEVKATARKFSMLPESTKPAILAPPAVRYHDGFQNQFSGKADRPAARTQPEGVGSHLCNVTLVPADLPPVKIKDDLIGRRSGKRFSVMKYLRGSWRH